VGRSDGTLVRDRPVTAGKVCADATQAPGVRGLLKWLTLGGLLLSACAAPTAPAVSMNVVVEPVATATGLTAVTFTPTAELSATPSAVMAMETATDTGLRTKTPVPGSQPSLQPSPSTPGAIGPAPDTSAYGVTALLSLELPGRTYRPNQKIWFRFEITNLTDVELTYGFIGVVISDGRFHTSWSGSSIGASSRLNWRDWVSVRERGDYTLTLSMCVSPKEECQAGGTWVNLSAAVPITVR
jgi:hypothetical protein